MTRKRTDLHGVLAVDKATGFTSHDVVAIARRALGTREVGHTGTLDPMATGVLILAVGEGTKLVHHLTALSKAYDATLRLGQATDTLDADGKVVRELPVPALTRERVQEAAGQFLGEHDQRVPAFSAVKVGGAALYKQARKGQEVEAPVRRVRLDEVLVHDVQGQDVTLRLRCGKGFYVRAFARDLAEALGTVGHLTALRRTENGFVTLDDCCPQATLQAAAKGDEAARAALRQALVPLSQLALRFGHVVLTPEGVQCALHGKPIPLACVHGETPSREDVVMAVDAQGEPVALVTGTESGFRVVRGFRCS